MAHFKIGEFSKGDRRVAYKQFWTEMMPSVAKVVEQSFVDANMRNPTTAEVKDRVDKTKRLVDMLRQDFKWSKQRIKDNLLHVLRAELVGLKLDLEKFGNRTTW